MGQIAGCQRIAATPLFASAKHWKVGAHECAGRARKRELEGRGGGSVMSTVSTYLCRHVCIYLYYILRERERERTGEREGRKEGERAKERPCRYQHFYVYILLNEYTSYDNM